MAELSNGDKESSSLDRFRKRLERGSEDGLTLRSTRLPKASFDLRHDWGSEEAITQRQPINDKTSSGWLFKIFLGALFFFLATLAVAVYVLFFSTNIVSTNNIVMDIKGPNQVRSGDELDLETIITNRNKVTLRDVSLTITYPAGTIESGGEGKNLPLWRQDLDDLTPGQSLTVGSKAVLFGAQNSEQTINLKIEYHIPESNAVFTKEIAYKVQIGSATLDLSFDLPAEINSGKNFEAQLKIVSNAQTLLKQTAVKVEYPTGFVFQSASPDPVAGNNVWFIGDLSPGVSREIKINGSLSGQNEEVKSFKLLAGLDRSGGQGELDVEYGSLFKTVNLKNDFVSVSLRVNPTLNPGGQLQGIINWENNLVDKVTNGIVELFLSGEAINKKTVTGRDGFYNSLNNTIVWDKGEIGNLALINPGEGGSTQFSLSALPLANLPSGSNQAINLRLVFRGTRINTDETSEEIFSETEKTVKLGSLAQFASRVVYSVGPFKNIGPLPPKVGEETSYTVTWSIFNPTNQIRNGRVRVELPIYVKWLSNFSPLDERVIYDNTNREIVWNLGEIEPTGSIDRPTREVSFQVSFIPSLGQRHQEVDLTKEATFTGVDSVTGEAISFTRTPVDTRISTDPGYSYGMEKVIE